MAEKPFLPSTAFIAESLSGACLSGPSTHFERVETDSRSADAASLFVALRGERVDGHDFIQQALGAGCRAFLVSDAWLSGRGSALRAESPEASFVGVGDTLAALQSAARAWRIAVEAEAAKDGARMLKVGVTGSSGKTTVKELIAAILEGEGSVVRNPGNLNSEIGLPASLFLMRPWHRFAVFEMGINRIGEMDVLAAAYEPDRAVVTNIGTAHIGLLGGTREGIAREKGKIASRFGADGLLCVWEEDGMRDLLASLSSGRVAYFGPRSTDGFEGARDLGLDGWEIAYRGAAARFPLPGAHNLINALAAITVAAACGAGVDAIVRGLGRAHSLFGRSQVLRGRVTIVNDCYNANAESVAAAISFCDEATADRRVYVLGSMKELGDETRPAHRRTGEAAARSKADRVFFFGSEALDSFEAAEALDGASRGRFSHHVDFEDLSRAVVSAVREGDLVLVKASRSMALERLVERLGGSSGEHHVP